MKQAQAMTVMMSNSPIFLTGPPGSGKSYVLGEFVRHCKVLGRKVAVTASTGIAATHIGGSTIHSWSGIGIRESLDSKDLTALSRRGHLVSRYRSCDILVIDEVSMLPGRFLDMLNTLTKALRDDQRPFGGLQIILVGDMFQLPPVTRGAERMDFVHLSPAWEELSPLICYLDEQHRQIRDGLLDILEAMRRNEVTERHTALLESRRHVRPPEGVEATHLYSHNVDVDSINRKRLSLLPGVVTQFAMTGKGNEAAIAQISKHILAPQLLELKVGAEVMFVANDPSRSFVNGTRGRVVEIDGGRPIVSLVNDGRTISVSPHVWQFIEDEKIKAEVTQIPLRLAWAITIHKSQGMSIDVAEIDLSRSFTPGMGYVGLSRLRSLEGLFITGINAMALRLHPDIFVLDEFLREESMKLSEHTNAYVEDDSLIATTASTQEDAVNGSLLASLKSWRHSRAKSDGVPHYMIAHNAHLEEIAAKVPMDEAALLEIKGIGNAKVASFGSEILALTRAFSR